MKNKIIGMIVAFIAIIAMFANTSNAMEIKELQTIAANDINRFLTMDIPTVLSGHNGDNGNVKWAWYCMHEQSKSGNGYNMQSAIVDLGRNGLNSIESNSSTYGYRSYSTENGGGDLAAQIVYLAAKCYMNREPWAGTQKSPYRHAMVYYASQYANSLKANGLFNSGLDAGTMSYGDHISKYNAGKITEAQNYVNATKTYRFSNQSTANTQTIIDDGDWMFVGPYRIQKEGADSGGLSSWISSISAVDENGVGHSPDGWATNPSAGSVNGNLELPNGSYFYLAFRNNKPETVKSVSVSRKVKGGLRARFVFCNSDGGQDIGIYAGAVSNESDGGTIILPGVPYSSIRINKKDELTGASLPDEVQFIAYLKGSGYVKGTKEYTNDKKEAKVFTGKNGVITINNLSKTGEYIIYEIGNKNAGYLEVTLDREKEVGTVTIERIGQSKSIEVKNTPVVNLRLSKIDIDSKKAMTNVGFVIRYDPTGEYVINGEYGEVATFTKDIKSATTYRAGDIVNHISKLGKYSVLEVINTNFGYQEVSYDSPLKVGEYNVEKMGVALGTGEVTVTATNKRIYIKLSGYAWEDTLQGKQTLGDNQYNGTGVNDASKAKKEQDKRIANVKVTLRKANGEIIDTRTTKTITNTSGNKEDGAYLFGDYQRDKNAKKILIDDLNGAYIEFEYNGMCYKSIRVNASAANGNKSTDEKSRNAFNDKFSTIENNAAINSKGEKTDLKYDFAENQSKINYEGNYLYGYGNSNDEATKRPTYPIAGVADKYKIIANTKDASGSEKLLLGQTTYEFANLRKNSVEEIPNINLGVSEREQPDMRIENDVENVELTINNKTHRYTYGSKKLSDFNVNQDDSTYFNVGVSFKNQFTGVYKRAVYQADYNYTIDPNKPSDRKLQVYMIYRVAVYNESTNLKERLNSIIQYYDSRYEIDSIGTELDSKTGAIANGTSLKGITTEETNGYKKSIIEYPIEVDAQKVENIYIRFKLNDEAVLAALNKTNDSEFKTLTEINSYSTLDTDGKAYAGIDRDSNPGNAEINKSSDFEDDTSAAPGIQLALEGNRQLSGIVFEDKEITKTLQKDNERIGNGIYDEGESGIGGIYVTMTEKTGSKAVYITETNDDGTFNLPDGFIPGTYEITYTWGEDKNSKYNVKDYKATIWTTDNENEKKNLGQNWYKSTSPRYSDAKDNYETRQNIDYGGIKTVDDNSNNAKLKTMESTTNLMNMEVEYDSIYNTVKDENVDKFIPEGFDVKNIDFGLILRPIQKLTINKSVYKFKATLANGQVIADCTIENGKLDGEKNSLTYMGPLKTGNTATSNGTVKLELDNELIQGANIEIQYRITIKNESEKDYQTQEYYENGENRNNPVTITPTKIYDYLDTELAYQESENWEVVPQQDRTFTKTLEETITQPGPGDNDWKEVAKKELADGRKVKYLYKYLGKKQTTIQTNIAWKYTTISTKREGLDKATILSAAEESGVTTKALEADQSSEIILNAKKLITNDGEINLDNSAEIVEMDVTNGRTPEITENEETFDEAETVVVTPSTGENKNFIIPIAVGITALIILATGVVIIKKKII